MLTFSTEFLFLEPVEGHVCMFKKRPDPSNGGILRWSLPYNERCLCQGVVAPEEKPGHSCPTTGDQHCADDDDSSCKLWFTDDPRPLTRRRNWNKKDLDDFLQRSEYCGKFKELQTNNNIQNNPEILYKVFFE